MPRILISRIAERPENSRVKSKLNFRCKQGEAKAKIGRTVNVFEISLRYSGFPHEDKKMADGQMKVIVDNSIKEVEIT